MTTYAGCTDPEAQNCTTAFLAGAKILSDAIAKYTALAASTPDPTDHDAYANAAMEANAERTELNSEYFLWLNSGGDLNPPSDIEVTEIVNTADSLAQLIATNAEVSDILTMVEHGLQVISTLSPAAAAAGAAAAPAPAPAQAPGH